MALLFGVDRCAPFTSGEVAVLVSHGVLWVGGYLGGPAAACTWAPSDVATLRAGGISLFAPIWVGPQAPPGGSWDLSNPAGNAATNAAGAVAAMVAFGLSGLVVLDVEQETWDANNANCLTYMQDWAAHVVAAGYIAGIYCNQDPMAALLAAGTIGPSVGDVLGWLADWTFTFPTQPLPHGATAQQWANDETYAGLSSPVDWDAAPPSFFASAKWVIGTVEMGAGQGAWACGHA
jgi:hypothetical protein